MGSTENEMGIGKRITRFGLILTLCGIASKLLLLVYTVFAVAVLGQERFGRIEYFIEMGIIFSVLLDFGLEQTITRAVARQRDRIHSIFYPILVYRILAASLGVVVMAAVLKLAAREGHTWGLILCSTTYFFASSVLMLVRALVRGFEWLTMEGIANLVDKLFQISLAMLCLFFFPRLPVLVLCYTAGLLAALTLYMYTMVRNVGWQRQPFEWGWAWGWQKEAFLIGLAGSCIMLLHRQDTAMVNWIRGDLETGLYRAPYRFLEGLFMFPQVLTIPAYPIFSKLYHENRPFSQTASDLLRGLMILCFPMVVGGTLLSHEIIQFLMPDLDAGGGRVFQILLWSLPFIYANFLLGTILVATDRQKLNLVGSVCGLVCNGLANIPAIYYWGAYGASVVTIASQGLYTLILLYFCRQFLTTKGLFRYVSILASCAVMAGAIAWAALPWFLEIMLGAGVYGIALILLQGISLDDLNHLRGILRKK